MPYLHGPQEDSNPIIDYIIKAHKYKQKGTQRGGGLSAARPDHHSLAQVLLDTRVHNAHEDERQLDGASRHLAQRGHMTRPVLLTQKLSMADPELDPPVPARRRMLYDDYGRPLGEEAEEGGERDPRYSSSQGLWVQKEPARRSPPRAGVVARWVHDKFDDGTRRSRSRSRSRSPGRERPGRGSSHHGGGWCRGRSLSRSPSPRSRGGADAQGGAREPRIYERPSPTYSPLREED